MSHAHKYLTENQSDSIRTVKHRLLVDDAVALAMVTYFEAYQDNKIFFSRALNDKTFNDKVNLKNGSSYFDVRNHFMANSTGFKTSLTARMWKNALEEAYLLQDRTYAGGLQRVKHELNHYVFNHSEFDKLTEADKKSLFLLNYIISKPRKYFTLLKYWQNGEILTGFQAFIVDHAKKVKFPASFNMMTYANKVKSTLTKLISHNNIPNLAANYQPTIRVDADCYTITSQYHEKTKQYRHYLSLVNFNGQKRFVGIELSGYHHIKNFNELNFSKSLTISFDYEIETGCKPVFYLHLGFEAKKTKVKTTQTKTKTPTIIAGDWGVTELFTFSNGDVFYPDNGQFYQKCADKQLELQRKLSEMELKRRRNKQAIDYNPFQLAQNQGDNFVFAKAQSNCAFKKLNRQIEHYQLKQATDLANYLTNIGADEFVYENIDVSLLKEDKSNRSRVFRRQVNLMTLHSFMNKVTAKVTQIKPKFKITAINPAYSSQTCPACGFVDSRSRDGDKFCCVGCGFIPQLTANCQVIPPRNGTQASQSDYVAALNLSHRYMCVDALVGIHKYTPKQKVKIKLLQLYEATKELGVEYESVLLDESIRTKVKVHLSTYTHIK